VRDLGRGRLASIDATDRDVDDPIGVVAIDPIATTNPRPRVAWVVDAPTVGP